MATNRSHLRTLCPFRATLLACSLALAVTATAPVSPVSARQTPARPDSARGLPLQPARSIDFSANRGTWMSLDVSPDGGTIVFDLMGDLYTMPIGGGGATRLTSGIAFDAQPRFSPDGERIAFVSDRSGGENLFTITPDGRDTAQITRGNGNIYTSPEWTPDGEYVIASRTYGLGGTAKLWLFHVSGGSGSQIINEPATLKTLGAAFGPDPRYIWYAQATSDWQYNATLPRYQVVVYDRENGRVTPMTARYGSGFRPAVSPDGQWLVYGSRHESETGLRRRNLETGEEQWLFFPVHRDDQEARATLDVLPGFSFTPDSREVVTTADGKFWRIPLDGGSPREIPFNADVSLAIGPEVRSTYRVDDATTFTARQIRDAVPSPDGRQIAFSALGHVYVMDLPGGPPRRVTGEAAGEHAPAWSPDGRSIAYVTWSDREGGHIWRAPADGRGQPQRLTTTAAFYSQPVWSPAGTRVVAMRSAARNRQESTPLIGSEFVWVPATGGAVNTIAPTGGRSAPHFAQSDSTRIYAYGGSDGLVSFRWDGTDERAHLKVTGATRGGATTANPASLVLMAPRGRRALALVEDHIYIVTVPYVGGPTPTVSVANMENAPFPLRQLTEVGGQFPAWGADGRKVHWSIGNAHFVYDIERAQAIDDSVRDAPPPPAGAARDTAGQAGRAAARYEPEEHRVRITVERDHPRGVAVLRGGRAITMRGEEIIENADVVIRDQRISAIGARGSVEVPAGANIIDVSGTTILPGYVDTHAHMRPPSGVHVSYAWPYLANLAYGVTTTRDPQTGTTDVLTYGDMVETGTMLGPRIYSTGPGIFGTYQGTPIRDVEQARRLLRRYSEYYDTKTFKMYLAGNREVRQWLIMAAREQNLMPTTEAGIDFKLDMTHAIDGYPGIEHNLPIYPIYDDVVKLFAESGVTYTPTLIVAFGGPMGENFWYATEDPYSQPKLRRFTPYADLAERSRRRSAGWFHPDEHVFRKHAEFPRDVMAAGGRIGIGGHGQLQGLGWHWELWNVQSGGMSEHDALRAATTLGAQAIGLGTDLGSLEAGKLADIVVLERNPLEDIRNSAAIRYVVKNGRVYEAETLNEIWPRQRKLDVPTSWDVPPARTATSNNGR